MLRLVMLSFALTLCSYAVAVEGTRELVNKAIDSGAVDAVEQIIDAGSQSIDSAAIVIEVAVRRAPRMFKEVLQGMAAVMPASSFNAAVSAASESLSDSPELAQQVAVVAVEVNAPGVADSSDGEAAASFERSSETPSPFENGAEIKPEPSPEPELGTPSLLQQIVNQVFELLGVDPPASPS